MPLLTGQKSAIGATALPLSDRDIVVRGEVRVRANAGNSTNLIYIGLAGITAGAADGTSGFQLTAGDEVIFPPGMFRSLADIYVIGSTTDLEVYWMCDGFELPAGFDFSLWRSSPSWFWF
ncbi:MAG TPA: hypothetical protein VEI97_08375 [bacterium]|nr:hypothetical protein [bacterium]